MSDPLFYAALPEKLQAVPALSFIFDGILIHICLSTVSLYSEYPVPVQSDIRFLSDQDIDALKSV